jgi:hypothetical protein
MVWWGSDSYAAYNQHQVRHDLGTRLKLAIKINVSYQIWKINPIKDWLTFNYCGHSSVYNFLVRTVCFIIIMIKTGFFSFATITNSKSWVFVLFPSNIGIFSVEFCSIYNSALAGFVLPQVSMSLCSWPIYLQNKTDIVVHGSPVSFILVQSRAGQLVTLLVGGAEYRDKISFDRAGERMGTIGTGAVLILGVNLAVTFVTSHFSNNLQPVWMSGWWNSGCICVLEAGVHLDLRNYMR